MNLFKEYYLLLQSFFQRASGYKHFHLFLVLLFFLVGGVMLYFLVRQTQTSQNITSRAASEIVNCDVDDSQLTMDAFEQDLFDRVNDYREQNNVDPLAKSSSLIRATAWKSDDRSSISHTDSLDRNPAERVYDCGYRGYGVAENIAQVSSSSQAFRAWETSDGHRENMINSLYTEGGVGRKGGTWVLNLGTGDGQPTASASPTAGVTAQPTARPSSTPPADITPAPDEVVVQVRVQIFGAGGSINTKPVRSVFPVQVSMNDVENNEVVSEEVQVHFDGQEYYAGYLREDGMEEGRYVVQIRGPHTLRKTVEPYLHHLVPGEINELPVAALVVGDFDGDNALSFADVMVLAACTQNNNCSRREDVDLNFDGQVDVRDYNLLLQSFMKVEGD